MIESIPTRRFYVTRRYEVSLLFLFFMILIFIEKSEGFVFAVPTSGISTINRRSIRINRNIRCIFHTGSTTTRRWSSMKNIDDKDRNDSSSSSSSDSSSSSSSSSSTYDEKLGRRLDMILQDHPRVADAAKLLQKYPNQIHVTGDRWDAIFNAIEQSSIDEARKSSSSYSSSPTSSSSSSSIDINKLESILSAGEELDDGTKVAVDADVLQSILMDGNDANGKALFLNNADDSNSNRNNNLIRIVPKSNLDISTMYSTLQQQGLLRLFGAIGKHNIPVGGSYTVEPRMLEERTNLSITSFTPSNNRQFLFLSSIMTTIMTEYFGSIVFGWDFYMLLFVTVVTILVDIFLLDDIIFRILLDDVLLSKQSQTKTIRHEAGHFLCAYLLGSPIKGYVLSARDASKDGRFNKDTSLQAGVSYFDPILSLQLEGQDGVTRSSIDRFSIAVMAGIAAEAMQFGNADGGAGDETSLIQVLANLNGHQENETKSEITATTTKKTTAMMVPWNNESIRNQARWGVLQAILLLREYRECYDALVQVMERNGSLGDCIYAIELAGRKYNKVPLKEPLGYIMENETSGKNINDDKTNDDDHDDDDDDVQQQEKESLIWVPAEAMSSTSKTTKAKATTIMTLNKSIDSSSSSSSSGQDLVEKSMEEQLKEYKDMMKTKLKDIEKKLGEQ